MTPNVPRRLLRRPPTPAAVTFLAAMLVAGLVTYWFGTDAGLIALILGLVGPVLVPQIYSSRPAAGGETDDAVPAAAREPVVPRAADLTAGTPTDPGPDELIADLAIALLRLGGPGIPIVPPGPRPEPDEPIVAEVTTPVEAAPPAEVSAPDGISAPDEPLDPQGEAR